MWLSRCCKPPARSSSSLPLPIVRASQIRLASAAATTRQPSTPPARHSRIPPFYRSYATMASTFTPPTSLPPLPTRTPSDVHTLSSIDSFRPIHLHLDWTLDWSTKTISGSVEHTIRPLKDGQKQLVLDSSYLDIHSVTSGQQTLDFQLQPRKGSLGAPLVITLPEPTKADNDIKLKIKYSTTQQCTALGWLAKEQTAAKTAPFLYSQCQAIHCRSLVPLFDSPWWKVTYTANVHSQYPVLMSALPVDPSNHDKFLEPSTPHDAIADPQQTRTYAFSQKVSIPSYLIAIVAGHLSFAPLGPRTGLWAEEPDLARCKWEFEEGAEKYLTALETIVSPYSWTRYDSVVLPPSFPYGGMENANMTTLTPTLIVGDRSQCDVLLHELSHSWSGNLTSCGDWSSFWLNEGINVYLERLALQYVHGPKDGPAHRGFSYIIGAKALVDARKNYEDNPRFQRLVPVFKGTEDPDDAFSSIPYEAGSNLILHLERTVGGVDNFLPFIKSYFKTFYDRSVTTQDFLDHLFAFYASSPEIAKALKEINWEAWLHGEGIDLPVKMEYDDTLAKQSFSLAKKWLEVVKTSADPASAGFSAADVANFDTDQLVVFLERIHEDTSVHVTEKYSKFMDDVYGLSSKQGANCEVMLRFYEVALEDKDSSYKNQVAEWVSRQGRMKYNRPIYRSLYKIAPELARETFKAHRGFYHPIATSMIEKDLNLSNDSDSIPTTAADDDDDHDSVVVVLGSTGTGKSQLGVEIAQHIARLHQESSSSPSSSRYKSAGIISCDSMQVYRGLDVITNKATVEEMADVRHELIDFLPVGQEYSLSDFISNAKTLGENMLRQGQLPVAVGGTTYYAQHLLFPGNVVTQRSKKISEREQEKGNGDDVGRRCEPTEPQTGALREAMASLSDELKEVWQAVLATEPTVDPPVDSTRLWSLLQALDPVMASRWHPLDGRKICNSLRVIIDTGRQCSEWIKMQEGAVNADGEAETAAAALNVAQWDGKPLRILFLWVWADKAVLDDRLNARVEKMIPRGLLDEIQALRRIARGGGSPDVDYTRGIFQAIGYKEFRPFLDALDEHNAAQGESLSQSQRPLKDLPDRIQSLFQRGLEDMKTATRQYARKQIHWISNQLMPEVRKRQAAGHDVQIAIFDTGDVEKWEENVRTPALDVVDRFLDSRGSARFDLTDFVLNSQAYQRMLEPLLSEPAMTQSGDASNSSTTAPASKLEANMHTLCEACTKAANDRYERKRGQHGSPLPVYYRAADKAKHEAGKLHRSAVKYQKALQRFESQGTLAEDGEAVQRKREERARRREGDRAMLEGQKTEYEGVKARLEEARRRKVERSDAAAEA